jgi:hypothetical protein
MAKPPLKTPSKKARAPAKKASAAAASPEARDICFVIMPFGGWLDSYYESVYCPAISLAGLKPHRADDLFRPSTIVNDIWAYTKKSKVMLADLTGKNANVFYELGLAHALAKPVILIAEAMEDIPFDLRALRIILYDKNAPDWGQRLGEKITGSLTEVLASPVEAVLPAFLDIRATAKPSITAEQKELIEIKQEMDALRRALLEREPQYSDRPPRTGGADYARSLTTQLLRDNVPEPEIVKRVKAETGAPTQWVLDQIKRQQDSASSTTSSSGADLATAESTNARTAAIEASLRAMKRQMEAIRTTKTEGVAKILEGPGSVGRAIIRHPSGKKNS